MKRVALFLAASLLLSSSGLAQDLPDLAVTQFSFSSQPKRPRDTASARIAYTNVGSRTAYARVRVLIDRDSIPTAAATVLYDHSTTLQTGFGIDERIVIDVPRGSYGPLYAIGEIAMADTSLAEASLSNNRRAVPITIQPGNAEVWIGISGDGAGVIVLDGRGVSCAKRTDSASVCTTTILDSGTVRAIATVEPHSVLSSWGEGCATGNAANECIKAISGIGTTTISARIDRARYVIAVRGRGLGTGQVFPNFSQIPCTILAGAATGNCSHEYQPHDKIRLTAVAGDGSGFAGWFDDADVLLSSALVLEHDVQRTTDMVARFDPLTPVRAVAEPLGAGTIVASANSALLGANIALKARPAAGFRFLRWRRGAAVLSTSDSLNVALTADSIFAVFGKLAIISATVIPPGAGTVVGTGEFLAGDSATLIAAARAPYQFRDWRDGDAVVGTSTTLEMLVAEPRAFTARFARPISIGLIAEPPEGGVLAGGGIVDSGATVSLRAYPAQSWRFASWRRGASQLSSDTVYQLAFTESETLFGRFVRQCRVTVDVVPAEAATLPALEPVDCGASVTVHAEAKPGWVLRAWTQNGDTVARAGDVTVMLDVSRNLKAEFSPIVDAMLPRAFGALRGGSPLADWEKRYLDERGNADGLLNLGDILALLDREQSTAKAMTSSKRNCPGGGDKC